MDSVKLSAIEKFFEGSGNSILMVIIALIFGIITIKMLMLLLKRLMLMSKLDNALVSFFLTASRVLLYIVLLLYCLQKLKVPLTTMIAILSATGVAIGLAVQDSIANVANGLVMIGTRPFKVGDYVKIGDEEGTIEELRLMNTILCTVDNRRLILPNKMVFNSRILNYNSNMFRRLDLQFSVDYDTDVDTALTVIRKSLKSCQNVLDSPAPQAFFWKADSSSLEIMTWSWIDSTNYFPSYFEIQKTVYDALADASITIPFPQVTLSQRAVPAKDSTVPKPPREKPTPVTVDTTTKPRRYKASSATVSGKAASPKVTAPKPAAAQAVAKEPSPATQEKVAPTKVAPAKAAASTSKEPAPKKKSAVASDKTAGGAK